MVTPKEIIFEEEARNKLKKGINIFADVAAVTLGPKGRNVGLDKGYGAPSITSDGNSIVKDVELKDKFENMGVSLGKEMAEKIKEKCGDGTTTGIVLFRELVRQGLKNISSGANPIDIKREMEKTEKAIVKEIEKLTTQVKSDKETMDIATVSASGNREIGEIIAQCFKKVGKTGVITIEEAKGIDTTIEMVEGMEFDRGYISAYFCTNAEKMNLEMKDPLILITDKKISSVHDILNILQSIATTSKELLIISEDLESDALSTLVINKLRGTLKVAAVKAPGFGDRRKELLEDIAVLTSATVITEEKGISLKDATLEMLGSAEKIIINKEKTTIINGKGKQKAIKERIAQIEAEIKRTTSSYDREKLEERKAKLMGGVALIRVGAPTEPEMKQKKQIYEDSLNSTRAALEEGIVPGGGVTLLRAANALKKEKEFKTLGAEIVFKACEAPCRQIIKNAGCDESTIIEEVLQAQRNFGFNALSEKIEDLIKVGVMDPAKVIKNSLTHAISMAGVVLISEALIADSKEEEI